MKITKKKVSLAIIGLLIVIQFFRPSRETPEVSSDIDFIEVNQPSEQIASLLKNTCYDCHSYQTKYPWYSNVAPVSWFLASHINEGREHLNFSEWAKYDAEKADHKLEEMAEEVGEGNMPLNNYTWLHSEAKLSDEQRELIVGFAESLREKSSSTD